MKFLIVLVAACAACWYFYTNFLANVSWGSFGEKTVAKISDVTGREISIPGASSSEKSPGLQGDKSSITISDSSGRELECEILGKASDFLAVRRASDQKEFILTISELSREDQLTYGAMPDSNTSAIDQILGGGSSGASAGAVSNRTARWHYSLVNAKREASKIGKPILMVFCADW